MIVRKYQIMIVRYTDHDRKKYTAMCDFADDEGNLL